MKRTLCALAALLITVSGALAEHTEDIFAMDTYMSVTCYGTGEEQAAKDAIAEIQRLDSLLSISSGSGEVYAINHSGGAVTLSEDTSVLLAESLYAYEQSGGAFDITVLPLMELWGFTTGEYKVPDDASLSEALTLVGADRLTYDGSALTLGEGQTIDFGGIAKGYTSDRLMQIFKDSGITCAMVNLGGNVELYGTKIDGSNWRVGIRDPNDPEGLTTSGLLGKLECHDCAVITSGAYERNFTDEATGKLYHHIIDPSTGYPAESGVISSTIVSSSGMLADAYSTSCYILGVEKASEMWRNSPEGTFDMILMTDDNNVYVTEGIADSFTSQYPVTVITR